MKRAVEVGLIVLFSVTLFGCAVRTGFPKCGPTHGCGAPHVTVMPHRTPPIRR